MSEGQPLIKLEDVRRAYRSDCVTQEFVLHRTSMEVMPGTWTAISGMSGAGKTTLLNLLSGLDRPDDGKVWMFGREIGTISESALADIRRELLGIMYQQFHLIEHLPVWQNVTCRLIPAGVSARLRRERAQRLLKELGLNDHADRLPAALSGGERQRVCLARAAIDSPRVLIADEPTSNVDAQTGEMMIAYFKMLLSNGVTIVTSTHDPRLMEPADFHHRMDSGRIV